MIMAFKNSRNVAVFAGLGLGAAFALGAWLFLPQGLQVNKYLITALAAFVGVNIALYIARMFATREYQAMLLYFYERLDPQKMLTCVQPLVNKKMDASSHCTLMVHIANAHLYSGNTDKALEILSQIKVPEKALEMQGLILSNKANCYIYNNNINKATECISSLRTLIQNAACKKEFVVKARHTIGYMLICKDIKQGKNVDVSVLVADSEKSKAPLHLLEVNYYIALAYQAKGDKQGFEKAKEYVLQRGQNTALHKYLQ